MTIVTRFNPSVNGSLHMGHLYTALVNEALAIEGDGRFYVRFDDTAPAHLHDIGRERMDAIRGQQEDELIWLGLHADAYMGQAEQLEEVHEILKRKLVLSDCDGRGLQPEFITDKYFPLFPAVPLVTAEKVVFDHMIGTTLLVRGMDLMTEYSLYQYFCERLGYESPRHVYLPRLSWANGDMSKRFGGLFIADLKADGYKPEDIRWMLAKAALRHPWNGWTLLNLKGDPRL
jgi:glutamyl/glutaminyl-tRNA synthetase